MSNAMSSDVRGFFPGPRDESRPKSINVEGRPYAKVKRPRPLPRVDPQPGQQPPAVDQSNPSSDNQA